MKIILNKTIIASNIAALFLAPVYAFAQGQLEYHEAQWSQSISYQNVSISQDSVGNWGPWSEFEAPTAGGQSAGLRPQTGGEPYNPTPQTQDNAPHQLISYAVYGNGVPQQGVTPAPAQKLHPGEIPVNSTFGPLGADGKGQWDASWHIDPNSGEPVPNHADSGPLVGLYAGAPHTPTTPHKGFADNGNIKPRAAIGSIPWLSNEHVTVIGVAKVEDKYIWVEGTPAQPAVAPVAETGHFETTPDSKTWVVIPGTPGAGHWETTEGSKTWVVDTPATQGTPETGYYMKNPDVFVSGTPDTPATGHWVRKETGRVWVEDTPFIAGAPGKWVPVEPTWVTVPAVPGTVEVGHYVITEGRKTYVVDTLPTPETGHWVTTPGIEIWVVDSPAIPGKDAVAGTPGYQEYSDSIGTMGAYITGYATPLAYMDSQRIGLVTARYEGASLLGSTVEINVNFGSAKWDGQWSNNGAGAGGFSAAGNIAGASIISDSSKFSGNVNGAVSKVEGSFFGSQAQALAGRTDVTLNSQTQASGPKIVDLFVTKRGL